MEFKIKLLQFNIKALCLTDFIIAKFWVRIFTCNISIASKSDGEKNNDLILSNIVSVFQSIIK